MSHDFLAILQLHLGSWFQPSSSNWLEPPDIEMPGCCNKLGKGKQKTFWNTLQYPWSLMFQASIWDYLTNLLFPCLASLARNAFLSEHQMLCFPYKTRLQSATSKRVGCSWWGQGRIMLGIVRTVVEIPCIWLSCRIYLRVYGLFAFCSPAVLRAVQWMVVLLCWWGW